MTIHIIIIFSLVLIIFTYLTRFNNFGYSKYFTNYQSLNRHVSSFFHFPFLPTIITTKHLIPTIIPIENLDFQFNYCFIHIFFLTFLLKYFLDCKGN